MERPQFSDLLLDIDYRRLAPLITIGFFEIFAFVASAPIENARWQVNVTLSVLYVVGIGLSGWSLFKRDEK